MWSRLTIHVSKKYEFQRDYTFSIKKGNPFVYNLIMSLLISLMISYLASSHVNSMVTYKPVLCCCGKNVKHFTHTVP